MASNKKTQDESAPAETEVADGTPSVADFVKNGILAMLPQLLSPLPTQLAGLAEGLVNLQKVVPKPKQMLNTTMEPGIILLGRDGASISLNAPHLPSVDVPFRSLVAMVERLFDRDFGNVVIQDIRPTDRFQNPKPLMTGHINPFYSIIAVSVAEHGERLKSNGMFNRVVRYYVHRHELVTYYLIAKTHLHGMQRLTAMDALLAGWGTIEIPYAIDAHQDMIHREQLHADR